LAKNCLPKTKFGAVNPILRERRRTVIDILSTYVVLSENCDCLFSTF